MNYLTPIATLKPINNATSYYGSSTLKPLASTQKGRSYKKMTLTCVK